MSRSEYESWGRWIPSSPERVVAIETGELPRSGSMLAYGLGRSYGDVCLNNGATLLDTSGLGELIEFDEESGVAICGAALSLDALIREVVPRGWFLPVTPGTRFVTVAGCVANDVHGKNHHRSGTFGRHVLWLELLRSDGVRLRCSPDENIAMYRATVGGLGLTGLIVKVALQLRPIASSEIVASQIPFRSLEEFDELSRTSEKADEYSVAWFDSLAGASPRGILFRGNHAEEGPLKLSRRRARRLPVSLGAPFLNSLSVRAFNTLFFAANAKPQPARVSYDRFFYPLDAIADWNSIYGRKGFLQYQFLVPSAAGLAPVAKILGLAAESRLASFLTVIKRFGAIDSPGLLSFPREGTTVCLDFAARRGDVLLPLLRRFDAIVQESGGSLYPAKDARMPGALFRRFYPQWETFAQSVDPRFSSSFWRRVMQ